MTWSPCSKCGFNAVRDPSGLCHQCITPYKRELEDEVARVYFDVQDQIRKEDSED